MKFVLATGIYPPDIGGPATYVRALAEEFARINVEVIVVTYCAEETRSKIQDPNQWRVVRISKSIPIVRWISYASALRKHGKDADVIIAFSSVSVGVPLVLARLKKPKKILRLGGDFLWERYTDRGGMLSLAEWYSQAGILKKVMQMLLASFNHIVFSTRFQEELYEKSYRALPAHSVIENAFPGKQHFSQPMRLLRTGGLKGNAIRLLFLGRFVRFKNVPRLIQAVADLRRNGQCRVTLSLVGDGPEEPRYRSQIDSLGIADCSSIRPSAHGEDKQRLFAEHDLLILPSLTEISPHTALEASMSGLPVLLTLETGLSKELTQGMMLRPLRTAEEIAAAILEAEATYATLATGVHDQNSDRGIRNVADEFLFIAPRTAGHPTI